MKRPMASRRSGLWAVQLLVQQTEKTMLSCSSSWFSFGGNKSHSVAFFLKRSGTLPITLAANSHPLGRQRVYFSSSSVCFLTVGGEPFSTVSWILFVKFTGRVRLESKTRRRHATQLATRTGCANVSIKEAIRIAEHCNARTSCSSHRCQQTQQLCHAPFRPSKKFCSFLALALFNGRTWCVADPRNRKSVSDLRDPK